jgi:hypothetical protein
MGGPGSSRWGEYYERKVPVEECILVDVRKLRRALCELPEPSSGSLWAVRIATEEFRHVDFAVDPCGGADGGPVVELTYDVGKGHRLEGEAQGDPLSQRLDSFLKKNTLSQKVKLPIELTTTSLHRGVVRWYFTCPLVREEGGVCARRVAKLWLPEGQRHFGCRECYDLTYASSVDSYALDKLIKIMAASAPDEALRKTIEREFKVSISSLRSRARKMREDAKSVPEILREIAEDAFPDN